MNNHDNTAYADEQKTEDIKNDNPKTETANENNSDTAGDSDKVDVTEELIPTDAAPQGGESMALCLEAEKAASTAECENTPEEIEVYNTEGGAPHKKKLRIIPLFIGAILVLCALTVYGILFTGLISSHKEPLGKALLEEIFGTGIVSMNGTYSLPPLPQVPPQTVGEDTPPGAGEAEVIDIEQGSDKDVKMLPIKSVDISAVDNIFSIINETPYTPDTDTLYNAELKIPNVDELHAKYGENAPIVLILHTHGSESYSPSGADSYSSDFSFRSYNPDESVVAVGEVFAETLVARGIGTIHVATMFDIEDFNSAYSKAAQAIRSYLEIYPSISYIFDVHRDAMITTEGVNLKPLSGDGTSAQVMLVVGTDHGGSGHTEWEDNLSLALKIQKSAAGYNSTLMRALNLRSASFNEQYTKGSLLIEVGAAGNSLDEAKNAARTVARSISDVILGE
ncbi:MAG: hypothetical protein HFE30_09595 [Clostridiales bacterium]|nr:hypothetical protein [Clostridiales bacterium]